MRALSRRKFATSRCFYSSNSVGSRYSPQRNKHKTQLEGQFVLQDGNCLENVVIEWEQWGDARLPGNRTVLLLPSFSHGSHAASNLDDPRPGWWQHMLGPNLGINTSSFRVICPSVLGSPFGTTSPLSINPNTGKPYRATFPQITPADMAVCHARLLDDLKIEQVHAVIGGSMGGMQALEFAAQFPHKLNRLLAISCTPQTTPGTVALRHIQRHAILADSGYNSGEYKTGSVLAGMKIARELGMACYRSREEFDARFQWQPIGPTHFTAQTFDVESYMDYQATKFARYYDPNCYLLLSKAMDLMNLGQGYSNLAQGVSRIECDSFIVGVQQDQLIPIKEQATLVDILQSHGRNSEFVTVNSRLGHDAMFHAQTQKDVFSNLVREFVESKLEEVLLHEVHRYSTL